jgi:hypothetical protein
MRCTLARQLINSMVAAMALLLLTSTMANATLLKETITFTAPAISDFTGFPGGPSESDYTNKLAGHTITTIAVYDSSLLPAGGVVPVMLFGLDQFISPCGISVTDTESLAQLDAAGLYRVSFVGSAPPPLDLCGQETSILPNVLDIYPASFGNDPRIVWNFSEFFFNPPDYSDTITEIPPLCDATRLSTCRIPEPSSLSIWAGELVALMLFTTLAPRRRRKTLARPQT